MIFIQDNIPLASCTIYKIGGQARFFVEVSTEDELREALAFAKERSVSFVVIGAGSNVLVSDNGYNGLVIRITGGSIGVEDEHMHVDAGVMMARVVMESGKQGLHGFEWGIGVPGTVGGSIRGNAGCFGGEMKDIVESVEIFDTKAQETKRFSNKECIFGYRDSVFKTHLEWVIMSATLRLHKGDAEIIGQEIRRIMQERIAKQDIGSKCCGCIFKNVAWPGDTQERAALCARFPELSVFQGRDTIPAAFLIDRAGLKGMSEGNICISEKHANFFINKGEGTSEEVMALMAKTKEAVKKKFGIELQEEIQMIGF